MKSSLLQPSKLADGHQALLQLPYFLLVPVVDGKLVVLKSKNDFVSYSSLVEATCLL